MNKLNHVAFIMDGNGRWGQKRNKGRNFGHFNGVEVVKKIVGQSVKLNIPIIIAIISSIKNTAISRTIGVTCIGGICECLY